MIRLTTPSKIYFALAAAVAIAVCAYWMLDFAGPYRWVVSYEMQSSGAYHPFFGFMAAFVSAFVVILMPIVFILTQQGRMEKIGPDGTPVPLEHGDWRQLSEQTRAMRVYAQPRIMFFVIGAGCFLYGVFTFANAKLAGAKTDLDIAQLEAAPAPSKAQWVSWPKATYDFEHEQCWSEDKGSNAKHDCYLPIVSKEHAPGAPIAAILHLELYGDRTSEAEIAESEKIEGMINPVPLSGLIKDGFTSKGLTLSPDLLLIDWRTDPELATLLGEISMGFGAFFMLACGVDMWVRRICKRRSKS